MKKILVICPFDDIYPPTNGGMKRCFHIIDQLALHFELTVIINQKKEDFLDAVTEYPAIKKATVYSTRDGKKPKDVFIMLPLKLQKALRFRWYKKNTKGPADDNFLLYYVILKKLLKEKAFDVIVLESMALNAMSLIRKYNRKAKIIYNAHNVDTNLAQAFMAKKEITEKEFWEIKKFESSLYNKVDAIFCCSKKDKNDFDLLNNGKLLISVIPNGIVIPEKLYNNGVKEENPQFILFCGILSTLPNTEGLHWFCQEIWPTIKKSFPHLKLLVVGGGTFNRKYSSEISDASIIFSGRVPDVKEWYNKAAVSVVPLLTGSGTRLKILEAMAFGVPVLSTSKGAEGIEYSDKKNIVIANDAAEFAGKLSRLLSDKQQRMDTAVAARKLVKEKYDWNVIGSSIGDFLNHEV